MIFLKKLTSVPNLNILSQKLANPLLNVALHFLIGIPFWNFFGRLSFLGEASGCGRLVGLRGSGRLVGVKNREASGCGRLVGAGG